MLTKRIIPCLDVDQGRVVKGVSYVNHRDAGDPVELAAYYDQEGADELVFLDITASIEGRDTMVDVVERTGERVFIPFTVGGGIRSVADMRRMLRAGADKVGVNSAAVADPELIRRGAIEFGSQCIVLAIDAKRRPDGLGWVVYTHGGHQATEIDAVAWAIRGAELGAGEILLTSMDEDGQKDGYDLALTASVSGAVPIPVIASGGAGTPEHLYDGLVKGAADAVLAASIFHYGNFRIRDVKDYLAARGLPIRPVEEEQ
ncbi:MAG: imidazole glycerol phosphate synthase subunit HisF [Chloroflexi bacterium]|nr:imidazole glycerol phosphate synthase subunit HisF [Chloroflexota bacterium]